MLPEFTARQRQGQEDKRQQSITEHLVEREPREHVVPYSDERFKRAALEWVIATNQVWDAMAGCLILMCRCVAYSGT